ncbi:uncharacterized protein LOC132164117 [Corylus avellana]|uniref:uncharacterized protein LOC132164117 n=1 Tax=Corylus avellana TaxID=13451 RepID=UPI001E23424E|nr:uncharacterized protein LOC132164117 [Corylus avellana]
MEGTKKQQGFSPSSFTADLFGAKESPPSSAAGTFASIFPPPPAVVEKNSSSAEVTGSWQKQNPEIQTWNMKQGTPAISSGGARCSIPNKDRSSIFQEERVEPCHLSSSLYYGGQDIYSQSPSTQTSGYPLFKENGAEDENGNSASRGNWWQGSLYY